MEPVLSAFLAHLRTGEELEVDPEELEERAELEARLPMMPPPAREFLSTALGYGCRGELGWFHLYDVEVPDDLDELGPLVEAAGWPPENVLFFGASAGGEEVVALVWNDADFAVARWGIFEGDFFVDGGFDEFFWVVGEVEYNDREVDLEDFEEDLVTILKRGGAWDAFTAAMRGDDVP